jgi:Right handed beta helix region
MLFRAASRGAIVTDNTITNIKQADGKDGIGIYLDSTGPSRHIITNNVIRDCDSRAISGAGDSCDIVIANNLIDNSPAKVSGASVHLFDAQHISIAGNTIINNRFDRPPVQMAGTSDKWTITNNQFYNNCNNNPALVGSNNSVFNNYGVNPQGSHALVLQP